MDFLSSMRVSASGLDAQMKRMNTISSNIANAETPNYRAVDIDFTNTMAQLVEEVAKSESLELKRSDPRHFTSEGLSPGVSGEEEPRILFTAGDSHSIGNDNNSVNLELELSRLQMNATLFAVTSQLLDKKLEGLANVIESSSRY